jgi:hypothetical protein
MYYEDDDMNGLEGRRGGRGGMMKKAPTAPPALPPPPQVNITNQIDTTQRRGLLNVGSGDTDIARNFYSVQRYLADQPVLLKDFSLFTRAVNGSQQYANATSSYLVDDAITNLDKDNQLSDKPFIITAIKAELILAGAKAKAYSADSDATAGRITDPRPDDANGAAPANPALLMLAFMKYTYWSLFTGDTVKRMDGLMLDVPTDTAIVGFSGAGTATNNESLIISGGLRARYLNPAYIVPAGQKVELRFKHLSPFRVTQACDVRWVLEGIENPSEATLARFRRA